MLDTSWSFSPLLVLVAAGLASYLLAWRRAQDKPDAPGWGPRWCAQAAALLAVVALASPLARVGEQLVSVHMVQHLLLLDSISILIVVAGTPAVLGSWLPRLERAQERAGLLLHPVTVLVLYAGGIWFWNLRPFYEQAVSGIGWHALQHLWMLGSGVLFWWYVIGAVRPLRRPRGMAVFAFVTAAKLITGALATVILGTTLAEYPAYADMPRPDGFSAYDDRLLAGAIMLFEELVAMSVALTVMFVRMLGESDEENELADGQTSAGDEASLPTPGTNRPTRAA